MVEENVFVRINTDDDDRDLQKGEFRSALNVLPANQGISTSERIETVFGNKAVSATLPTGNNSCIGYVEDKVNNKGYYFLHNSSNNHSIWEFDPVLETTTKILENSNLGFSSQNFINRGVVVEGVLFFTDGENEVFSLSIADAKNGDYNSVDQTLMTLIKVPPLDPPTAVAGADASVTTSSIISDGFQFAVRYIYNDNAFTTFGPLSRMYNLYAVPDPASNSVKYTVSYTVPAAEREFIQRIEFAFQKNNDGVYRVFDVQDVSSSKSAYDADFYNTDIVETISSDDQSELFSAIPRKSEGIELHKNRLWLIESLAGYNPVNSVTFSIAETTSTTGLPTGPSRTCFKEGGKYKAGIVWYDKYGRSSGVTNIKEFNISYTDATSTNAIDPTGRKYGSWSLSGSAPSWATHYQVVRTQNLIQSIFINCPLNTLFYVRDKEGVSPTAAQYEYNDRIYLKAKGTSSDPSTGDYSKLYLQLPTNIPILPEKGWRIRLVKAVTGADDYENIIDVIDDELLVVNNFGLEDWTSADARLFVEIFKPAEDESEVFYEIDEKYAISGTISDSGIILGDVWDIDLDPTVTGTDRSKQGEWTFNVAGYSGEVSYTSQINTTTEDSHFYSPTPVYSGQEVSADISSLVFNDVELQGQQISGNGVAKLVIRTNRINIRNNVSFTLDYTKVNGNSGRPNVEIQGEGEEVNASIIRYSDLFVQNSSVNGLFTFRTLNEYTLPFDRGKIRSLIGTTGNVLLAIHEITTSSLSVGEEILQTQDGEDLISKTDEVIGTERELGGDYGTINPESVTESDGIIWWFDAYNAEVIRYAGDGVTPLALAYKNKTTLLQKGEEVAASGGLTRVLMGYEQKSGSLYIHFGDVFVAEETEIYNESKQDETGTDVSPAFDGTTLGDAYRVTVTRNPDSQPTDNITFKYGSAGGTEILNENVPPNNYFLEFTAAEANATVHIDVTGKYRVQIYRFVTISTGGDEDLTFWKEIFDQELEDSAANYTTPTFEDGFVLNDDYRIVVTRISNLLPTNYVELKYGVADEPLLYLEAPDGTTNYTFIAEETETDLFYDVSGDYTIVMTKIGAAQSSTKETLMFWENQNAWRGNYSFLPDNFGSINNKLLSWSSGALYIHGEESGKQNNFYGVVYDSEIRFVVNTDGPIDKVLQYIMLDSNEAWDVTKCETPEGQDTDLVEAEFELRDNVYYANFKRDKNTNADLLSGIEAALVHGNIMKGRVFEVTLFKDLSGDETLKELKTVYVGFHVPPGQLTDITRRGGE